ncbi:hypothetical protein PQR70_38950 [Paraburkholderia madseniana]|uniref:Uncharacterized protein n=1 Tax=Paraburkholderia madseniana TaxID=2599607 RepID=A0AAP5BDC8_9BURK|nr:MULTISPECIES: hypothetical protein [Paraburkholderia]MCX4147420.1 hypothetical protein [Paraburkholderia madseniana]MDN7150363.1 hypothetical protein [Paraburkholderia sp. WS6]MDQ6409243.1 hypothetical protein [Paraburkholderia madseniana]
MLAFRLKLLSVSGTPVFTEHLVRHAVMTKRCALPAVPENRVMPSPLASEKITSLYEGGEIGRTEAKPD